MKNIFSALTAILVTLSTCFVSGQTTPDPDAGCLSAAQQAANALAGAVSVNPPILLKQPLVVGSEYRTYATAASANPSFVIDTSYGSAETCSVVNVTYKYNSEPQQ